MAETSDAGADGCGDADCDCSGTGGGPTCSAGWPEVSAFTLSFNVESASAKTLSLLACTELSSVVGVACWSVVGAAG